jgi:hypothetical protein
MVFQVQKDTPHRAAASCQAPPPPGSANSLTHGTTCGVEQRFMQIQRPRHNPVPNAKSVDTRKARGFAAIVSHHRVSPAHWKFLKSEKEKE